MNYGKLTAGTTKTAIDTAKPSEKGEIITYLSRMGDVLEPVLDPGEIVVHAVGIGAVEVVVDGDEAGAVLGESQRGVEARHSGVSAQTGQILDDAVGHLASLDLSQHLLKTGTVK